MLYSLWNYSSKLSRKIYLLINWTIKIEILLMPVKVIIYNITLFYILNETCMIINFL